MFGRKALERGRTALVTALKTKSFQIATIYKNTPPEKIPLVDAVRVKVLTDIAEIIENLGVEEKPEDKE